MKSIVTTIATLLSIFCFAQKNPYGVADDLLKDKDSILAKSVPASTNMIPSDEFLGKMKAFQIEMQKTIDLETNEAIKNLKTGDLDFYIRNRLNLYRMYYGMDTVALANIEKLMVEKKASPDFEKLITEAYNKLYVKRFSAEEKKLLELKIWDSVSMNDAALFKRSSSYRRWVDYSIDRLRNTKYNADTTLGYSGNYLVQLRVVNKEINDPFIKECLSYDLTSTILSILKNEIVLDTTYKNFIASAGNGFAKNEIQQKYDNVKMMASNAIAPDFAYNNADNKKVSLKKFRGKYVYIDVWATWCTPCKAEIPFLSKLEEEYKNKNIQFVSLSVDKKTDKAKWQKYVKDKKLGGVQVMADKAFESTFVMKFNIMSIPRFILLDPAGRIIDADAKRPSDEELKKQLDLLLENG